jgi:purine-nucleoside phosphorylase
MSTVPEVIAARHMGIRCLGISVVTNMAAGVVEGKLDHEGVLTVAAEAQPRLTALLRALLPALAA